MVYLSMVMRDWNGWNGIIFNAETTDTRQRFCRRVAPQTIGGIA
jgi:hypothetical protein